MKHALHQRVLDTIEKHSMLSLGDSLGIGVSGGADSVCLLHVLLEIAPEANLTLEVAHYNRTAGSVAPSGPEGRSAALPLGRLA